MARRRVRHWCKAVLLPLVLCYAASALAVVSLGADEDTGQKVDCIFVPGMAVYGSAEPGLGLQARLEKALELYRDKRAPLIVVSGGDKGDHNESEVMAAWLKQHGVPESAIVRESRARSTRENGLYSAPLMHKRGIKKAFIVSQWFHLPRVRMALHDEGIETINVVCQGPEFPGVLVPLAREAFLMPVHAVGLERWFVAAASGR